MPTARVPKQKVLLPPPPPPPPPVAEEMKEADSQVMEAGEFLEPAPWFSKMKEAAAAAGRRGNPEDRPDKKAAAAAAGEPAPWSSSEESQPDEKAQRIRQQAAKAARQQAAKAAPHQAEEAAPQPPQSSPLEPEWQPEAEEAQKNTEPEWQPEDRPGFKRPATPVWQAINTWMKAHNLQVVSVGGKRMVLDMTKEKAANGGAALRAACPSKSAASSNIEWQEGLRSLSFVAEEGDSPRRSLSRKSERQSEQPARRRRYKRRRRTRESEQLGSPWRHERPLAKQPLKTAAQKAAAAAA